MGHRAHGSAVSGLPDPGTSAADQAACGQDENLAPALAHPEITTTYCLINTLAAG